MLGPRVSPGQRAVNLTSAALRLAVAAIALLTVVNLLRGGGWAQVLTFTLESNAMVAVAFVWTAVTLIGRWRTPPEWLSGSAVFYLAITGLVYNIVLRPETPSASPVVLFGLTNNQLEHVVTPIAAVAIWLVFDEHRRIPWKYVVTWLYYLVGYIAVILTIVAVSPTIDAPYPFLDTSLHGVGGVTARVAFYVACFAALSFGMIGLDHWLPARTRLSELDPRDPRNR